MGKYRRIKDVAERLNTDRVHVHRLIRAGMLEAVDISAGKSSRANWRIADESLQRFLAARSNRPKRKQTARRKSRLEGLDAEDAIY